QSSLAQRPVVLKIAADVWGEAQTLAQLQHTNVVPVYSVHHASPLQAVCMPYLGALTLGHLLAEVQAQRLPDSGAALVRCLLSAKTTVPPERAGVTAVPCPAPLPGSGLLPPAPALELLQRLSYVEAVLWIAERLADGLAHAHEHGIVHCDLKPANV